jgi:hypothetical protein
MYEYHIINRATEETNIIFGYDYNDACKRNRIDPKDWFVQIAEYID